MINIDIFRSMMNLFAAGLTLAQHANTCPAGRAIFVSGSLSSLEHVSVTTLRNCPSEVVRVASCNPKERDRVITLRRSRDREEMSWSFAFRISNRIVSQIEAA
jgi:hypothetical protein